MTTLILKNEIDVDPLGRVYSGMNNQEVADDMNTEYRTSNRVTMSASEVYQEIDETEMGLLDAEDTAEVWNILHLGVLDPFGKEKDKFAAIFGGGSTTITNLQAARLLPITRGSELGLGKVKPGHVEMARAA